MLEAGAVRFHPIALTAAAVVIGGGVMVLDPIFQELAVSLMAGAVAATLLTMVAVPLLYWELRRRERKGEDDETGDGDLRRGDAVGGDWPPRRVSIGRLDGVLRRARLRADGRAGVRERAPLAGRGAGVPLPPTPSAAAAKPAHTIIKGKHSRWWEVRDPADELVCLTVYRKGAREVVRRLAA